MTVSNLVTTTYSVIGMTCQHCVSSITEDLSAIQGVTAVAVNLAGGTVTITSERQLAKAEVAAAVAEAGYAMAD